MAARKALDFMFTQRDLYWLDHLLPDESRRKKEDTKTLEQRHLEQVKPSDYSFYVCIKQSDHYRGEDREGLGG